VRTASHTNLTDSGGLGTKGGGEFGGRDLSSGGESEFMFEDRDGTTIFFPPISFLLLFPPSSFCPYSYNSLSPPPH
jgi:hypothetical protein